MLYIMDKAHDILTPTVGSRLTGDVTHDGEDFLKEYDRIKNDPLAGVGQFTGLHQMDVALSGAKRNELWLHAAFTGHFKSGLMLNWAYNQAIYYRHNSLIFSLEMPYIQCRKILYAMHSGSELLKKARLACNIKDGLEYGNIRDGLLTDPQERYFKEHVVPHFNDPVAWRAKHPHLYVPYETGEDVNEQFGSILIEIADPDKLDFTVTDMRSRAETLYAKTPFSLLFVDHALLVSSRGKYTNTTEKVNEVIRDCKKMAMSFNKGMGMAVMLLFQINREGYKQAMKSRGLMNEGSARRGKKDDAAPIRSNHVYNLTSLSYANEAERSADIVTASWKDIELDKVNQILYQCLKSRDQAAFEPFTASVHWPTRRLSTLLAPGEDNMAGVTNLEDLVSDDM